MTSLFTFGGSASSVAAVTLALPKESFVALATAAAPDRKVRRVRRFAPVNTSFTEEGVQTSALAWPNSVSRTLQSFTCTMKGTNGRSFRGYESLVAVYGQKTESGWKVSAERP